MFWQRSVVVSRQRLGQTERGRVCRAGDPPVHVIENLPLGGSIQLSQVLERTRIVLNAPDQGLCGPVGWLRKAAYP